MENGRARDSSRLHRQPSLLSRYCFLKHVRLITVLSNFENRFGFREYVFVPHSCFLHCISRFTGFLGALFLMNHLFFSDWSLRRYLSLPFSTSHVAIYISLVWYRRCVTFRLVLGVQSAAFIRLILSMKSHYTFLSHLSEFQRCSSVGPNNL